MTETRVDQLGIELIGSNIVEARITQIGIELLHALTPPDTTGLLTGLTLVKLENSPKMGSLLRQGPT